MCRGSILVFRVGDFVKECRICGVVNEDVNGAGRVKRFRKVLDVGLHVEEVLESTKEVCKAFVSLLFGIMVHKGVGLEVESRVVAK